jgi:CRP/FNR family transcriptional regulator
VAKGQHVFRQADAFAGLYVLRSGAVKTYEINQNGTENITGFHLPGDIIGFDGLKDSRHQRSALGIEDASLCLLHEHQLYAAMRTSTSLCGHVLSLMSGAMDDDQQRTRFMKYGRAEERLAAFLLQQSRNFGARNFSAVRFRLPMSRTDIAGYLGLTLESVSRAFRRLLDQRVIKADGRELEVLDATALRGSYQGDDTVASHESVPAARRDTLHAV